MSRLDDFTNIHPWSISTLSLCHCCRM